MKTLLQIMTEQKIDKNLIFKRDMETVTKKEVIDELFLPGEDAILNDDFVRGEVVRVVRQTPKRLYTTVERYGQQWDVMTYRLSKQTNEQLREWNQDYERDF